MNVHPSGAFPPSRRSAGPQTRQSAGPQACRFSCSTFRPSRCPAFPPSRIFTVRHSGVPALQQQKGDSPYPQPLSSGTVPLFAVRPSGIQAFIRSYESAPIKGAATFPLFSPTRDPRLETCLPAVRHSRRSASPLTRQSASRQRPLPGFPADRQSGIPAVPPSRFKAGMGGQLS